MPRRRTGRNTRHACEAMRNHQGQREANLMTSPVKVLLITVQDFVLVQNFAAPPVALEYAEEYKITRCDGWLIHVAKSQGSQQGQLIQEKQKRRPLRRPKHDRVPSPRKTRQMLFDQVRSHQTGPVLLTVCWFSLATLSARSCAPERQKRGSSVS